MRRFLFVVTLLAAVEPAFAQDTTAVADTTLRNFPPGKALMRSLLIPGWGQFSVGASKRGAFFVLAQGTSYYMLAKTRSKLNDARDKLEAQREFVRDSILSGENPDTTNLENRIDDAPSVVARNSLVSSRERQWQDWVTYTLFFTLTSGVDAFVAAHLADFPVQVGADTQINGRTDIRFTVPFPERRRR
jgi:hypothetical protein